MCEPGRVESCPCLGSASPGVQACEADGSRWGMCQCGDMMAQSVPDMGSTSMEEMGGAPAMPDQGMPPVMEPDMAMPPVMEPDNASVMRGAALYGMKCVGCHGQGASGGFGPNLVSYFPQSSPESARSSALTIINNGKGQMPPIAVSEAEANDIIDYLISL